MIVRLPVIMTKGEKQFNRRLFIYFFIYKFFASGPEIALFFSSLELGQRLYLYTKMKVGIQKALVSVTTEIYFVMSGFDSRLDDIHETKGTYKKELIKYANKTLILFL